MESAKKRFTFVVKIFLRHFTFCNEWNRGLLTVLTLQLLFGTSFMPFFTNVRRKRDIFERNVSLNGLTFNSPSAKPFGPLGYNDIFV